jgi:hypothetical protein
MPETAVPPRFAIRDRAWALWAREHWLLVAAIALGVGVRIFFWAYTDRRFEDALITIAHSRNAADGLGLTHHLGEGPVHGFTSALSVLIPIPGELIAEGGGFTAIRLVSLVAFAAAAAYAYGICRGLRVGRWPLVFVLAYLALDQIQIFFGMSGMETQIAVAVLLGGAYYLLKRDFPKSGAALGLALLVRPDFALWVVPAYIALFIADRARALNAALVSAAIVAPWLIFTTLYYGSPVPNTIAAKSQVLTPDRPAPLAVGEWIDHIGERFSYHDEIWKLVSPFWEQGPTLEAPLPKALLIAVAVLVVVLAIAGAVRTWRVPTWRPVIAFVLLYVIYTVMFQSPAYFTWYFPPVLAALVILAGVGLTQLGSVSSPAAAGMSVALAALFAIHIPFSFPLDRRVQALEDQVRKPLGEFLGRVVGPDQTVTTESSGYVGYYSRARLVDWPGLTSPHAVDLIGEMQPEEMDMELLIAKVEPDWIVQRPWEWEKLQRLYPATAAQYELVRTFEAPPIDFSRGGLKYFLLDLNFLVLKRKGVVPEEA